MLFVMCEKKEQPTMVWKTTDGFHVSQQSYPHIVTSALKNFHASIFGVVGYRRNIFNDENFPIYGIEITPSHVLCLLDAFCNYECIGH